MIIEQRKNSFLNPEGVKLTRVIEAAIFCNHLIPCPDCVSERLIHNEFDY